MELIVNTELLSTSCRVWRSGISVVLIIRSIAGSRSTIAKSISTENIFTLLSTFMGTSVLYSLLQKCFMHRRFLKSASELSTAVSLKQELRSAEMKIASSLTHCDLHLSPGCVAPVRFSTSVPQQAGVSTTKHHGVIFTCGVCIDVPCSAFQSGCLPVLKI